MANLAQIQSIAQGQFFVKDSLGNLTELKVGDTVSLNDTIVAASSNTDLSKIEILFDTNELITLSQGEQLLDTTLLASTFGNEELAFDKQEVDETLNAWNNAQDGDETDMETAAGDVTEQATNAGDERAADGGALRSKFNSRDGDATDIVSDLREASWTGGIERTNEDSENMLLEQPLPVVYTIIEGIDVVNEGDSANYVVKLQDAAGNPVIATQDTIIYVRYTNKTTQDGDTQYNNENIIEVVIKAGTSQTEFTIKTNDDYLADNGEIYNVSITGNNSTEFDMRTGDVAGNKTNVDTTILDNSNPLNPGGEDGGYGSEDTVYVKISQPSETLEGGKLSHTVTLVDKDGNPVTIPAGEKIIVTLTYTSTDGVTDGDFSTIVKEVELVSNGTTFENTTIVDNTYEGSENYKVTITDVKQTNGTYENVAIHQTENSTTGKITDNPVQIVLVATDSTGTIPLKVDGTVDLEANKNSTPEGGKLYYVAVAVDTNGKPLDKQTGKVDVSYNNTSDITDKDAILSGTGKDIKNNPTVVEIGKTFTVDAEDDYYAEGDEKFNVTISNPKDTGYDTGVLVKSGADTVTSTIKDNPADSMKPDTNTGTDNPDGGNYGKEDTVYVKISQPSETLEGGKLSHTVTLVDKDGNPVTIPAGEKIIVTLTYTSTDGVTDGDFSTIVKEVELVSNGTTFENTTIVDNTYEGSENYKVTITDVKQTNGTYENVAIHQTENSTTGKITDNPVQIVLVATDSTGTIPLKVDGTVDLEANKNSTPEGGKLYYVAVAVDTNGKPLDKQTGKVDVSYNNTSDITDKDAILSGTGKDIKNNPTVVEIGKTFTVDAEDDYYAEGDEKFNVTISNPKDTGYDTGVLVKSGADTVTSTIKDNPADSMKPDTNTGTDNPDGGNYGKEDTVYVRIVQDSQTIEGGNLNHKIQLVDKDGKPVEIPAGEKITVKLQYIPMDGTNVNDSDFVNSRQIEVTLDNSVKENGYYKVQITNKTQVDFDKESTEKYQLEITGVSQEKNTYENITIDSKNSSVTGTILDGITFGTPVDSKVDEDNFYQNDLNGTDGGNVTKSNLTASESLGITIPNGYENTVGTYTINFAGNPTVDVVTKLTSDGKDIHFQTIGNKIIAYIGTDVGNGTVKPNNKVFEIVLNKSTGKYDYTQYKNIDHPKSGNVNEANGKENYNDNDNIDLNFKFNITTTSKNGQTVTSPSQEFKVTVNDSTPIAGEQNLVVYEDNSLQFIISDGGFKGNTIKISNDGGNTYKTLTTSSKNGANSIDILENGQKIGTLKNLGSGKLQFIPEPDYSKYSDDNLPNFKYEVYDTDGDYAEGKVNIKVKPVADAPTIFVKNIETTEDNNNTQESTNKVALELIVPSLSKDQTDKNNATGDSPERNGEITLKFTNGNSLVSKAENKTIPDTGAKLFYITNGVETDTGILIDSKDEKVTVILVKTSGGTDIDTTYHHSGTLPAKGGNVLYLTKEEYESLKIQHAEDNDTNIQINIGVTSYEVNDNGEPLFKNSSYDDNNNSNLYKNSNATMTVVIKPVTDDIELKFDTNSMKYSELQANGKFVTKEISGTISSSDSNTNKADTFTLSNTIKEGDGAINLQSILSATSGALNGLNGTKADLDGSEKRIYTISDIPEGTVVTLGGQTAVANKDGIVTIVFNDTNNTKADPTFTMKFPENFSGEVKATITLSVIDKGVEEKNDSNKWGETKEATVHLNLNVTPVADDATVKVGQPVGYEDAGRDGGNTKDKSGAITNPTKGIVLPITVTSTDKDGSETFTVTIKDIPNGSGLYIFDKSSNSYKLVESKDGKLFIDGTENSLSGNISIKQENGKFKVEIKDYQNSLKDVEGKYIIEPPKFIPPHNSHGDFNLKIDAKTVDTATINGNLVTTENQTVTDMVITVVVKDVADFVVGNEYKTEELVLADNSKKSYNTVANEDEVINLKSIFTDSTKLSSYDKESEDLTIIIKDLPAGITLEGSVTLINGQYIFKASDIPNIKIVTPQNYSGELNFKIDYITTEAGKETKNPSKTFDSNKKTTDSVSIFVKPTVDAGFKSNTTKAEDIQAEKVDGEANSYYKLDLGISHKNGDNDETLVSVTIDKPANGDYILVIKGANGTYTEITDFTKTYTEAELKNIYVQAPENKHGNFDITGTYTVKDSHYGATNSNYVATKTDDFKHTLNITPVTDKPTIAVEDGVQTKIEVISGEAKTIEIPIKVTSSDKDGSENITKIVISGVPQGVTISFGDAELDAKVTVSVHNGIYTIVPKDGNYKLNDADFKNITFNVTSGANFEHRNITITSYTQDAAGSSEESTSTVITLDKTHNGNGGGNGSGIGIELKDGNPYQTTEDTEFNFLDVFKVVVADGGSDGRVTLNFTLDSTNATIKGLTPKSDGSYTITGNRADIESVLANLKVVPNKDYNDNHTTDKGTLDITVTIDGKTPVTAKVPVTPVTDSGVITITPVDSATTIDENGEFKFDIKFENNVDIGTTLKDNAIYIKANENYKDSNESSTGKLYYIDNLGNKVELDADGKFELKDGYTIDNLPKFVYEAGKNRNGDVSITVSTENKESNADNYTLATGSTSITVQPVVSSEIKVEKVQDGIEDGQMASVKLSVDKYDPSEKFESVLIKVASGVAVYHGSNGSSLAMNVGDGSWLIPVSGDGKTLPEIFFKGKEHLGGEIEFTATINAKDGEAKVTKELTGSVTITEVADGVTIDPTKTGIDKNAFEWTSLNLNANMKDLDGSEKMHFTLEGLDSSAQFRIVDKDGNITDLSSQSKFENGKWTINGIEYEDINNIQITHDKSVKDIKVEAWTQDGQDADISNKVEGKFDLNFTQDALKDGTLTLGKEMNIDFSKIESGDIKDVSTIDLGAQGENKLLNLTLQDVMDIGKKDGGNINLTILGDSQDKVSFADKSQWQKSETTIIENGKTFTQWSNTSDSTVTLKIEQPISDGITN
ncbi:hypothetical protein [Aliarcobacter cryaerophilus]|uniref:hypothetical protein n=1 Tax=Aliarcobacter cryaerophilus TaxID=28198 RepID=UPI001653F445|nr:hypothetical protein [Aliarcobacter cryaerophilus]QNM88199.1 hypothetical protein HOO41_00340 [Aliarcobacter cryaerophilus]